MSSRLTFHPTAEETAELLTEGQRLKAKLREQYASQIEAALRDNNATINGNKSGTNSVELYYYSKSPVGFGTGVGLQSSTTAADDASTVIKASDASVAGASSPTQQPQSPSKRELMISQGYLPESASTDSEQRRNAQKSTAETIVATHRAIADADERERRLKALINQHDPIRSSLRQAQDRAIKSLISATETSLEWEMRLAKEEVDPSSPIHQLQSWRKSDGSASPVSSSPQKAEQTETAGDASGASAAAPSPTKEEGSTTYLHTSPFRETSSVEEKAALERRLELLLKLDVEHKSLMQCESATKNQYDERRRVIEEAVDVTMLREMTKAQEEARQLKYPSEEGQQ